MFRLRCYAQPWIVVVSIMRNLGRVEVLPLRTNDVGVAVELSTKEGWNLAPDQRQQGQFLMTPPSVAVARCACGFNRTGNPSASINQIIAFIIARALSRQAGDTRTSKLGRSWRGNTRPELAGFNRGSTSLEAVPVYAQFSNFGFECLPGNAQLNGGAGRPPNNAFGFPQCGFEHFSFVLGKVSDERNQRHS
jgi:hypothetical protein